MRFRPNPRRLSPCLVTTVAVTAIVASLAPMAEACDNDKPASTAHAQQCAAPATCCSAASSVTATAPAKKAAKPVKVARATKPVRATSPGRPAKAPMTTPAAAPATAPAPATTFTASGLTISIDPQTGRLVKPTPDQLRALGLAQQPATIEAQRRPLEFRNLPDGGTLMMMDDRFATYATVRVGSDGRLHYDCDGDPFAPAPTVAPATPVATSPAARRWEAR